MPEINSIKLYLILDVHYTALDDYYNYFENGKKIMKISVLVIADGMLHMNNVSRNCSDTYECVADNGVKAPVSRKFQLVVECESMFIIIIITR